MKKFIKTNIKIILGFTLGLVWSSGIAYAATILFDSDEVSYDNTTSGLSATNVQSALDELYVESTSYQLFESRVSTLESQIYPVGSIYISTTKSTAAQVKALFGGTWVSFGTGRTLVGVDTSDTSFDTVGETGGAKAHSLDVANLPVHNHSIPALNVHLGGIDSQWSVNFGGVGSGSTFGEVPLANVAASRWVSTFASNTDGCTNCSGTALSTQDKYITVYMYKRTA